MRINYEIFLARSGPGPEPVFPMEMLNKMYLYTLLLRVKCICTLWFSKPNVQSVLKNYYKLEKKQ